ncbi:MAG TPA: DUF3341 domain-containing protein, partial [Arenibaculum sp.]|nr:DUF3341 domain-containing protein [Arenibaculum sp.]
GIPLLTLVGGVLGAAAGYAVQYLTNVTDYPLNVGGRPLHSWPSFLPGTVTLALLGAALTAVAWLLAACRLPEPYHPLFNLAHFTHASEDAFFLCIESGDPAFDPVRTRRFLEESGAARVDEVPR